MPLDASILKKALPHADMRVLVMVLYHYTGDAKWLSEAYAPRRDVSLIADEAAGFDTLARAEI